jgi:hypothetical protein
VLTCKAAFEEEFAIKLETIAKILGFNRKGLLEKLIVSLI